MGAERQKVGGLRGDALLSLCVFVCTRKLHVAPPASGNCVAASRTFNSRECKSKQHAQECDDAPTWENCEQAREMDGWMDGEMHR